MRNQVLSFVFMLIVGVLVYCAVSFTIGEFGKYITQPGSNDPVPFIPGF